MKHNTGMSAPTALTILFVGLKLAGYITWSWLWVLSPLWISAGLFMSFIVAIVLAAAIWGKG